MQDKKKIALTLAIMTAFCSAPQFTEAATTNQAAQQRYQQQQRELQQKRIHQQNFQNQLYNAYQNGVNAYQAKNYSTAVRYLSKVVQYERKQQVYAMLGDSYFHLKQPSSATKYLSLAVSAGAKDYTTLSDLGYAQMDLGNYSNAVKSLLAASKYYQNDADLSWNLGISYDKLGNHDGMLNAMKKVVTICPDYNADAYSYIGIILNEKKDVKQALKYFQKGVQVFPNDAGLNFHVGDNLYALGDYEGCLPYLQKSLKADPSNLDAYWTLGMAYVQLDDLDSASGVCDTMKKIAPKDSRTIELCKTVQEKVQQKMLQQQMEQDMMNQTMQTADGTDSAADAQAQTDNAAMQMAMGQ